MSQNFVTDSYIYNKRDQLTKWTTRNSSIGASYEYDRIGNLIKMKSESGTPEIDYECDALNRLGQMKDASGVTQFAYTASDLTAPPATSVTVNGNPATVYRDGSYARADEDLARDGADQRIDIVATGPDGERRRKRLDYDTPLPAANVYNSNRINFRLDGSGNMIQVGNYNTPGTRYYQYDGYRQLTHVYEADRWRTEYVYDGLNRQRVRKRFRNEGGNWVLSEERRYLYDGRQVIQERDENNLPVVTYTRGLDLSETMDGAGGIGGLLAYTEHQTDQLRTAYYHADANGNITAMINRHDRLVAQYQYDPFGNLLAHIGALSEANPYRFSSKQVQPDSGLYAYGLRFYDPSLQRWINQDPIGEAGGINLYGFVRNDPVNRFDPYGESDNNRLPAIVFRPSTGQLPVYGPPRPEPGVRPRGRDPVDSAVDAASMGLTILDVVNTPVSPGPDGVLLAAFLKCGKAQIRKVSRASLKRFKQLVNRLSKPEQPGLSQTQLDQLRRMADRTGGRVRVDADGVKGTGVRHHVHVEGLGPKIENRHIWIQPGVK